MFSPLSPEAQIMGQFEQSYYQWYQTNESKQEQKIELFGKSVVVTLVRENSHVNMNIGSTDLSVQRAFKRQFGVPPSDAVETSSLRLHFFKNALVMNSRLYSQVEEEGMRCGLCLECIIL